MNQYQVQFGVPGLTRVVKALLFINLGVWFALVLVLQGFFLAEPLIFKWFGLVPVAVVESFWLWQIVTYMFIHSSSVFHVLFNMLILWMFGSELEQRWGDRFFLSYYMVCGVGAALIYLAGLTIYFLATGNGLAFSIPVVGASGAVFGLILAYGLVFGERVIYFMMIFPMKAKYFALILGAIELLTLLSRGVTGQVANLAHLGGLIAGFLYLVGYTRYKGRHTRRSAQRRGRRLKLVVDNESSKKNDDGPRYWN